MYFVWVMPKGFLSKACVCASVTTWVLVSIVILTVTVVIYLRPIMQVLRYAKTTCRIDKDFYAMQYKCKCGGSDCSSFYPCYMVHVSFYKSGTEISPVPLYADDIQQRQVLAASGNLRESVSTGQISYKPLFICWTICQIWKKLVNEKFIEFNQ